jgi:hypothetical protein
VLAFPEDEDCRCSRASAHAGGECRQIESGIAQFYKSMPLFLFRRSTTQAHEKNPVPDLQEDQNRFLRDRFATGEKYDRFEP